MYFYAENNLSTRYPSDEFLVNLMIIDSKYT